MRETAVGGTPTGSLRSDVGEKAAVHFERLYDATADELWSALTEPERLRGWLAEVTRLELRTGGAFELHFGGSEAPVTHGRVREISPARVLEWDWTHDDGARSVVRFEIVPRDAGCALVLDHRLLDAAVATEYGAGWQTHLEALDALLTAGEQPDRTARLSALRPGWDAQRDELARGLGVIRPDGDTRALVFERRLDAPPERVWRALTDRAELRLWLTDTTIEPRVDGGVVVDWGEAGQTTGTVLAWEPSTLLEYTWTWEGVMEAVLRLDLRPEGAGTRLRLEHRRVAPRVAWDMGSGWHAFLDGLADVVAERPVGDWIAREEAMRPVYSRKAAALP